MRCRSLTRLMRPRAVPAIARTLRATSTLSLSTARLSSGKAARGSSDNGPHAQSDRSSGRGVRLLRLRFGVQPWRYRRLLHLGLVHGGLGLGPKLDVALAVIAEHHREPQHGRALYSGAAEGRRHARGHALPNSVRRAAPIHPISHPWIWAPGWVDGIVNPNFLKIHTKTRRLAERESAEALSYANDSVELIS